MKNEIDKKRPKAFEIEEHGQWLLSNMHVAPEKANQRKSTGSEVHQQLAQVANTLNNLNDELNDRRNRITAILSDAVSFDEATSDFDKWLSDVEKKQDKQAPISVNPDELKDQVLESKEICDDIDQHEPVYNSLLNSGRSLLGKNPEKSKELSKKLKDLIDRYDKVNDNAKKRDNDLTKALPVVREVVNNNKIVEDVNKEGESVLQSLQPIGVNTEEGNTNFKNIKVCQSYLPRIIA